MREPQHFLGKTLKIGNSDTYRCCHHLEKSLSPTIVSKEKKAYGVFTPFDRQRDRLRKANLELGVQSK